MKKDVYFVTIGFMVACGGGSGKEQRLDVQSDCALDCHEDVLFDLQTDDVTIEKEGDATPPTLAQVVAGNTKVQFDKKALTLSLFRMDKLLLVFEREGFSLGAVNEVFDNLSYDPWFFYPASGFQEQYSPPEGLVFLEPLDAELAQTEATSFTVHLFYEQGFESLLLVSKDADDRIALRFEPETHGERVAFFRLRAKTQEDEAFYGLGAWHDHVNHRGKTRVMQMEIDLESETSHNDGHVRVPLLIGSSGFGIFVNSLFGMVFDCASQEKDLLEIMVGAGKHSSDGLSFYLLSEGNPLDITRHYYELTGFPALPARWAFGPWIWRDEGVDQDKVVADLMAIRDNDLATTGYWIDRPYASAVNSFDFNPLDYYDPASMIQTAHDLGFRIALWHSPYVNPKEEASKPLNDYAKEKGFFPPVVGVPGKWGPIVDFTNPLAKEWWQSLLSNYTSIGVEGYKLDYGEEVVLGFLGMRTPWLFYDNSDERTMHHLYQFWYHKVYAETLPEDGGFLLVRTGTIGDQVHAPIVWPGDLDATFNMHDDPIADDGSTKKAVGGFPASVIYGVSLGPSGFPFYGADTGGYIHAPPDKELFTRWFEQTCFSSVMQVGNGASTVPWELGGSDGYDEEMLSWYRFYSRLHLRLWAYLWDIAVGMRKTGRPIQRPFGLQYPELGVHPWDQYMLGDELLIAPVMERGKRTRKVFFPSGKWVHFLEGQILDGSGEKDVEADLGSIPVFLKEDGIVPMLRPTIDTLNPVANPEAIDSYATTAGLLYVRVFPVTSKEITLFDNTVVGHERRELALDLSYKGGDEFHFGVVFEIYGIEKKPVEVTKDGVLLPEVSSIEEAKEGFVYDKDAPTPLVVKASGTEAKIVVSWEE
jgi:alpha-D-xyloside xylohydrolase